MFDHLMTDAQRRARDDARAFVKDTPRELILDMDAEKVRFPRDWLREAARRGLLGVRHPVEWGGRGLDWVASCAISEEIGSLSYELACVFGVGADLVCDAILQHGTDEQKARYVKPLLAGDIFAAECLTEPRGGSDFFGATCTAEDRGDHFLVSGQKRFIVGGEGADFFLLYARTNPDPNAPPQQRISCFIVDRGPGVEVKYLYGLMGCRGGGTARLIFKEARVPRANLVGELHGAYPVFTTMMVPERLGTAAMTIGPARTALDIATSYSSRRKAFGQVISRFQGVSFQVAEGAMLLDASRAMVHATCCAADQRMESDELRRMVSETKKFVTESCQKVVHNSMQVVGGIGYTNVLPLERICRDIRLASIWTGTNEVMAMIVAHEWYRAHKARQLARRYAADAPEADAPDELIYE
jgi:alkylation response protein AidB-like acyl-CoA dehydrogenase